MLVKPIDYFLVIWFVLAAASTLSCFTCSPTKSPGLIPSTSSIIGRRFTFPQNSFSVRPMITINLASQLSLMIEG